VVLAGSSQDGAGLKLYVPFLGADDEVESFLEEFLWLFEGF